MPSQSTGGDVVTFAACRRASMFSGSSGVKAGGHDVCRTGDRGYMNMPAPQGKVAQSVGTLLAGAEVRAAGGALKMLAAKEIGVIDPVSVASGDVFDEDVDLELRGLIPLPVRRLYSSGRHKERTPLGRGGFTHALHQWIELTEEHTILRDEDGRDLRFARTPPGASVFHRGKRLRVESPSEGVFELYSLESRLTRIFRADERGGRASLRSIRDAWGNAVELVYERRLLVTIAGTSGREIRLAYDAKDRIVRAEAFSRGAPFQAVAYAYTPEGELESVTDALNNVSRYAYDGHHRLLEKTLPTGVRFHYAYDEAGRCIKGWGDGGIHTGDIEYDIAKGITNLSGTPVPRVFHWDERGAVTLEATNDGTYARKLTYDDDLLITSAEDAAGAKEAFVYDERGNLVTYTDPDGLETRYVYSDDLAVSRTLPDGQTTEFQYTPEGALASAKYPSGRALSLDYDGRGRIKAIYDPQGLHASFEYDEQDNIVTETGRFGERTRYTYDPAGRVVTVTDPLGRTLGYSFDALGRSVARYFPDGTYTQRSFDALGRAIYERDPLGGVTAAERAGTHSLVKKTLQDGRAWALRFDTLERVRSITNPKQETWEYRYDRASRVVEEKTFDGRILRYQYAKSGALARIEHMDGTYRAFETDAKGALVSERSPHGSFHIKRGEGVLETIVDEVPGKTVVTSELDALGRLVAETQDGLTVRYYHDDLGRRAARVMPGGEVTRYRYDAAGFLIAVEHEGRVLTIVRDVVGNEVRRHLHSSGVDILSAVDSMDRVTHQRVVGAAPRDGRAVLVDRVYSYDARGFPRGVADSLRGPIAYEHDRIGQLIEVHQRGEREIVAYDASGSVVGIHRGATPPRAPWATRPGGVLVRAGDVEYEYDENRRRVSKTDHDGVTRYLWDCRDRLREVRFPSGYRAVYTYDVHGRRLRKDLVPPAPTTLDEEPRPVRTIRYLWDGPVLAAEIDSERGTRIFVHHPGTFTPLLQAEQGEVLAYVNDPLGTPKELIDERGQLAWAASHAAYGAVVGSMAAEGAGRSWAPASPFGRLGHYHDEETGMSYALSRYFDPQTARWLSPDPLGMLGGYSPTAWTGSPVAHVDPMGLGCIIGNPALDAVMEEALTIPPKPGYYDVVVHGSPYGVSIKDERGEVRNITPKQLALLIKRQKDYDGEKIRLLSCSTGQEEHGFAQQLAREMGKEVRAPNRDMSPYEHDSPIMQPFDPNKPPPERPNIAPPPMVTQPPPHTTGGAGGPPVTPPGATPPPPAMVPPGGWPPAPA